MNTGVDYFPEEFMVGASLATRQAFSLLSKQLQTKEIQPEVQNIFGPALLHRFMSAVPENTKIDISLPQIYDVNIDDIWVTMGPFTAFTGQVGYEVLQWMTLQVGSTVAPKGETFQEQQQRVKECIREGLQISVDLKIDADVIYSAVNDDDVLMYDEGRREVRVRFATPQFSPARNIVSRRDPDTGNPENDWNWTIVDIDQLVEKESIDE